MQPGLSRKLSAIVFTDIFGFTALIEKVEADAVGKKVRYKEVLDRLYIQYNGQIIENMGDGSLSVFTSCLFLYTSWKTIVCKIRK